VVFIPASTWGFSTELPTIFFVLFITPRHRPHKKHSFSIVACVCCHWNPFTEQCIAISYWALPSNGCSFSQSLHSNSYAPYHIMEKNLKK
jgi:hypothetical protein